MRTACSATSRAVVLVVPVLAPVHQPAASLRQQPLGARRALRPLASEMPGEIALRCLDGVLLLRQQPAVGDRRELARSVAERGEGLDTPIQPGDGFAPFAVRLALDASRKMLRSGTKLVTGS